MRFGARVSVLLILTFAFQSAHIVFVAAESAISNHNRNRGAGGTAQQQPLLEPVNKVETGTATGTGTAQVGQAAFYQEDHHQQQSQQGQQPSSDTSKSDTTTLSGLPILSDLAQDPLALLASGLQGHTSIKSLVNDSWSESGIIIMSENAPTDTTTTTSSASTPSNTIPDRPPLINFENNVPPRRLPSDSTSGLEETTIKLLTHSFANSYGKPARTPYSLSLLPASFRDPSKWTSLSLDQVGRARGRQFDRLGSIFLDGVEVVRTDNAEPVNTTGGVTWTSRKDVSKYFALFSKSSDGEIVFQYPNIVDETYTSPLNLTLSLTVQQLKSNGGGSGLRSDQDAHHVSDCPSLPVPLSQRTADAIFAISKTEKGPDLFNVPEDTAVASLTIPRNAVQALLEVYASGTAADEFWYTGVNDFLFDQTINGSNALTPHGPYREVQVLIDGNIAGIAAPYPVIFTGGLNPLLWRPQTSYGSYDQPTYLFDITPFLGVISDGKPHEYSIQVVSAETSKAIPKGWFVTANLQLALAKSNGSRSDANDVTKGDAPVVEGPGGTFDLSGSVGNANFAADDGALTSGVSTRTPRSLTIVGRITPAGSSPSSSSGGSTSMQVRVEHTIEYTSHQEVTHSGGSSVQTSQTTGHQRSTHGPRTFLTTDYSFPLSTHVSSNNVSLNASVHSGYKSTVVFGSASDLSLDLDLNLGTAGCQASAPNTTFGLPHSHTYDVTQDAQASTSIQNGRLAGGLGGNNSTIKYADSWGFTYTRTLHTYNYTVTRDELSGNLKDLAPPVQ